MRPLKFKPVYIGTIWGSEDWILSAMEGRQTVCVEGLEAEASVVPENFGEGAGLSLSALVEKYGARLVGDNVWNMYGNRFPLLIKYINSNQQLSVQVHPGEEMAKKKGLPNGKTEMWYVLDAKPDSELLLGFSRRFTAPEFRTIVNNSIREKDIAKGERTLEDVLNRFSPKRGDWYFIPAGTVHSIGAGVRILEIQQPSDTTYRLYDFNRVDIEGKRRHLDLEDALKAIDFDERQEEYIECQRNVFADAVSLKCRDANLPVKSSLAKEDDGVAKDGDICITPLARCPHFVSNFLNLGGRNTSSNKTEELFRLDNSSFGTFTVLVCTGGEGTLFYRELPSGCVRNGVSIKNGDLYLIPAELGAVDIRPAGGLQIVEAHLETAGSERE